ncbi:small subunit ribosomal protein S8e [Methanohalophilus levihalophilus]|uniref:30S ribosomal protein S8e n=1 Tax=Methanohalophilus levihalophilus TaxID=1431282 RepID=UPI001AE23CDE|nr:30S ribosomal protein S8e [Methanohalophilus levihalophilus]MBP2030163.1 small subunit ribosomal protein S8e [Methanohalophilus levihalophilus]
MQYQGKSRRTATGGKRTSFRGKLKCHIGREAADPHVADTKRKSIKTRGGNRKVKLLQCNTVNVTDPATGKTTVASIENVIENKASVNYVRRNILSKGSVIQTSVGNAKITSRPGQDGVVNAVLTE